MFITRVENFENSFINMVGSKDKNRYRKSRKGKGFAGVPKWAEIQAETHSDENENLDAPQPRSSGCRVVADAAKGQPTSASRKKLSDHGYQDSDSSYEEEEDLIGNGYRLVDINSLSSSLCDLHKCKEGKKIFFKQITYMFYLYNKTLVEDIYILYPQ